MTDELSIQQQPRQNGNYAVAGTVLGAGLGAAGGAATAYWTNLGYKSKAEYDKVIAMDQDSFKKQIEKAGDNKGSWEKAQELVKKVKDAEAEYDKIVEEAKKSGFNLTELPDGEIKTKLEAAQKAYDTELAKLVAQEENKNVAGTVANYDIKKPEFMSAREALGKKVVTAKFSEEAKAYDKLTNAVKKASNDVTTKLNAAGGAKNILDSQLKMPPSGSDNIFTLFERFDIDYNLAPDKSKVFNKTEVVSGAEVTTSAYNKSYNLAKSLIADSPSIINPSTQAEHYLQFGEFIEGTTKPVALIGEKVEHMVYVDSTGRHVGYIKYAEQAKKDYEEQLKSAIEQKRVTTAEEFLANAEQHAKLKNQLKPDALKEAIHKQFNAAEYLTSLGSIDNAGTKVALCDTTDWIKVNKILDESKGTFESTVDGKKVNGYESDIAKLSKAGKKMPKDLNGSYFDVSGKAVTPQEALEMAKKRLTIANAYIELENSLNKELKECLKNNTYIRQLEDEITKAYNGDKALSNARKALAERFPNIFTETESATVDAKAEAEKLISDMQVKKDLEAARKAAEEELQRLGKGKELSGDALTEAIKKKANGAATKEDYTKKIAEEAKTEFDKIAKDLKLNNKWATAAIGAVALGLVGLGIGAASKKSAPEEEIA